MRSTPSLWDMRWVLGVDSDGRVRDYSLRETFAHAHEIRGLRGATVVIEAAMFRLLLAIVIDVVGGLAADEWAERWRQRRFDAGEFERYAQAVEDRFHLFGEAPFYQVAGLEATSGEVKSTLLLFPEMASGNSVPLFSVVSEADAPVVPLPEAARRLVALHATDVAGIKTGARGDPQVSGGKTTGNLTGPMGQLGVTIPLGRNLFESLMLNCPPTDSAADDMPAWRRPPDGPAWETRPSTGILDLLTWQSRRVRLVPDDAAKPSAVVGVIVTNGDRLEAIDPAHEPHSAWRAQDAARGGMSQRPVRHQAGKAAWRGMESMVALSPGVVDLILKEKRQPAVQANALKWAGERTSVVGTAYPLNVRTIGIEYGNQQAVIDHVWADEIPLPVLALSNSEESQAVRQALVEVVVAADAVRQLVNHLANDLLLSIGGTALPWDKGDHPGDRFIALIDPLTRQFLRRLRDHPTDAEAAGVAWERDIRTAALSVAEPLIEQVPPASFLGRHPDKEGRKPRMNQAQAEHWFRIGLAGALPRAAEQETSERKQ